MYKMILLLICIVFGESLFSNAHHQMCGTAIPFFTGRNISSDSTAHIEKLGEGVYVIIHQDATDQWPHSNVGIIVGQNDVMVVDANYLPSRARADIPLIRSITSKPVRYLVFTHWHMDHNNGAVAYRDSFPGIQIISERETKRFIEINSTWYAKMVAAPSSAKRQSLAALQIKLSDGKDSAGKAMTDQEKLELEKVIQQRTIEIDELASLEVISPNKVFDGQLTIDLGNRRVQLKDWGKANSPHDVTIYVPDQKILFAGDILVQTPLPYVAMSWPVPWINVLAQLEKLPVKAIVPGHGPVLKDHSYTKKLLQLLQTVQSRVLEALMKQGIPIDVIQRTLNVDELRNGVWNAQQVTDEDWKLTINILTERMIRGVRGQG